jgi:hypothetical protein
VHTSLEMENLPEEKVSSGNLVGRLVNSHFHKKSSQAPFRPFLAVRGKPSDRIRLSDLILMILMP